MRKKVVPALALVLVLTFGAPVMAEPGDDLVVGQEDALAVESDSIATELETDVDLDPRLGDLLEEAAREAVGERYVDLWVAEDQTSFVLGVLDPTDADQELVDELQRIAPLVLAEAPVASDVLDEAVEQLAFSESERLVSVAPDYINGQVRLTVLKGKAAESKQALQATGRYTPIQAATKAPAVASASKVQVVVEEGQRAEEMQTLSPAEGVNSGPLRAGKTLSMSTGNTCTSNLLVQVGGSKQVLTAGHCGPVGRGVSFAGASLGSINLSTWYATGTGGTIAADVARLPAPSNAQPSVYVSSTRAEPITGWGNPRVNARVCQRGKTTNAQRCGKINFVNMTHEYGTSNVGGPRKVTGMSFTDIGATGGDSGAPVYYDGPSGVVVVGLLTGGADDWSSSFFSSIGPALSAAGATVVRAPGLGMPPATGLATPFDQLKLSADVSMDGRGELLAVDQKGDLVAYSTTSSGALVTPPALMGVGFTGHEVHAPGDWNGDGLTDLITVTTNGDMWLFKGLGGGSVQSKVQIGHGWQNYTVVPVGDVTSDGKADLLAVHKPTGDLYLYAGNGSGGFKSPYPKVGNGWTGFQLHAARDLDGDGKSDILSVDSSGNLFFYRGKGDGTFYTKVLKGNGWSGYLLASGADTNGDGLADIVGRNNSTRDLYFYRSTGSGSFATKVKIGNGW